MFYKIVKQMLHLLLISNIFLAHGEEIVCSYSDWAQYRPGKGRFLLDNVDSKLCTIINYSFASLDATTLSVTVKNTDFLREFTRKVPSFKSKNSKLKIILAMGGWSDSKDGAKYSRLVGSARNRKHFIDSAVAFLKRHKFDGLDLNWEYPVCWHANCDDSRKSESTDYGKLCQEIREAFDKHDLLITASVSGSKYIIDRAYDVPAMGRILEDSSQTDLTNERPLAVTDDAINVKELFWPRYLHMINVLTYDYSGTYRGKTAHHATMFYRQGDDSTYLNSDFAMKYWVQKGAPKEKLCMGVPFSGRSFTLSDRKKNGLYAPIKGEGNPGKYTNEQGYMGFNEICELIKENSWTKKRVEGVGPYAFKGDQWVSFDDPVSAAEKAKYVKDNGYRGIKIWELTTDDFNGVCCNVKFPMLRALKYGFTGKGKNPATMGC